MFTLQNLLNRSNCYEIIQFTSKLSISTVSAVEDLYETPSDLWLPGVAGPKFDKKSKGRTVTVLAKPS